MTDMLGCVRGCYPEGLEQQKRKLRVNRMFQVPSFHHDDTFLLVLQLLIKATFWADQIHRHVSNSSDILITFRLVVQRSNH
jgi:hypothetical protein